MDKNFDVKDIKQNGMDFEAKQHVEAKSKKLAQRMRKDDIKQGDAIKVSANRHDKEDLSIPIKLFIQGRNLISLDAMSQSDPICIVTQQSDETGEWFEVGRTECIENQPNPNFETHMTLNFYFEKSQKLRFMFIDEDGGDSDDPYYDLIGTCDTQVGTIMASRGQTVSMQLKVEESNKDRGSCIVTGEPIKESNYMVNFTLQTKDTPCKGPVLYGLLKKYTTTWFEIHCAKFNDPTQFTLAYTSPNIHGSLNMTFAASKIKMNTMCNSDPERPIKFKLCVPRTGVVSESSTTSVNKLKLNQTLQMKYCATHKEAGAPAGELTLHNFSIEENPNFVDYLRSGWQFSLTCAVDFTASNGEYNVKHSYHSAGDSNPYKKGITEVGKILEQYDQFKNFPTFGFGGIPRFMGENTVNHCFPLNGSYNEPEIKGIDGIARAYDRNVQRIRMGGPTFFSSIMDVFMDFAHEGRDLKTYFVLLILTDGYIHDFSLTKQLIVKASKLPCSIIIVGVGIDEFEQMIELDSDDRLLKDDDEREAVRDIVQFVRLNDCIEQNTLADEVLKELPDQFQRYMELIRYKPDFSKIQENVEKTKLAMLRKTNTKGAALGDDEESQIRKNQVGDDRSDEEEVVSPTNKNKRRRKLLVQDDGSKKRGKGSRKRKEQQDDTVNTTNKPLAAGDNSVDNSLVNNSVSHPLRASDVGKDGDDLL